MEDKVINVLLSGVGGQGTILASDILCSVFHEAGYDVKKSEVHGMAQRGGDVTTHFRFGKKVYSPLIKYGDVDYLVSFELLEGLRYMNWVKENGKILLNEQEVYPPAVNLGKMKYPEDAVKTFTVSSGYFILPRFTAGGYTSCSFKRIFPFLFTQFIYRSPSKSSKETR